MIHPINLAKFNTTFKSEAIEEDKQKVNKNITHLSDKKVSTRLNSGAQKVMGALIDYPVRGLMGDINTDFYEFLTMGIIPYLAGSAMFMYVFNITKHLSPRGKSVAGNFGKKMGLGVVLYGLMKTISKNLVTKPVKHFTGVDTEMAYENKVCNLPKGVEEDAEVSVKWQQRKVYDSKEFYRKDLLNKKYYEEIAKKLGLGENLNDPVTETSPIIQNIVSSSNLAKSLSSYCWAGVGVGLAVQDSWLDFFGTIKNRNKFKYNSNQNFIKNIFDMTKKTLNNTLKISKSFIKSFGKSFVQLWQGKPSKEGFAKNAGKYFILFTTALTALLTANTILRAKSLAHSTNKNTIDKNKESVEI